MVYREPMSTWSLKKMWVIYMLYYLHLGLTKGLLQYFRRLFTRNNFVTVKHPCLLIVKSAAVNSCWNWERVQGTYPVISTVNERRGWDSDQQGGDNDKQRSKIDFQGHVLFWNFQPAEEGKTKNSSDQRGGSKQGKLLKRSLNTNTNRPWPQRIFAVGWLKIKLGRKEGRSITEDHYK